MTLQQLIDAIRQTNHIYLNQAAAPYNKVTITDTEDYLQFGLIAGVDTADTIIKIVSPIGTVVYENTGFATDDYSAPDFSFDTITTLSNIALPVVTGGTDVVSGSYSVYVKQYVKVDSSGEEFFPTSTLAIPVQAKLLRTAKPVATYDCLSLPATFTVTDKTDVSSGCGASCGWGFFEVTREIAIQPPFGSKLPEVTGSSNPYIQSPLWTGTYGFSVEGTVVYVKDADVTEVRYYGDGEQLVVCTDILCKIYCCLMGLRKDYYAERNGAKKEVIWQRLSLGLMEYNMAVRAQLCGDTASVSTYTDKFYEVTGCNTNCDCCDDETSAPVIPIGTGPQGPPGAQGPRGYPFQ